MNQYQQNWSEGLPKDGILIPPEESLLEKALAVSPIVHYFPTPKAHILHLQDESQVTAEAWTNYSLRQRRQAEVVNRTSVMYEFYLSTLNKMSALIWQDYSCERDSIGTRGGGLSIGESIELSPPDEQLG